MRKRRLHISECHQRLRSHRFVSRLLSFLAGVRKVECCPELTVSQTQRKHAKDSNETSQANGNKF